MQLFLTLTTSAFVIGAGYVGFNLWRMRQDSNRIEFPAVDKCKHCQKHVYFWQRYARYYWAVPIAGNRGSRYEPDSAIFHEACGKKSVAAN